MWHGVVELGGIALLFVMGPITALVGAVGSFAAWIGGRDATRMTQDPPPVRPGQTTRIE